MNIDSRKTEKRKRQVSVGPCGEYNCPVCVFTKSQAPGNPYDLKDCPKYRSESSSIKNKRNE